MSKPLVIVESPAKAKTIGRILGGEYVVESSIGHIRDLPSGAGEIPEAYRDEPWARLAVNVEADFKPIYVVPARQKQQVRKLKAIVKEASELYLATDEDREGESIAWHLMEVLSPRVPVKRMVFHEITRPAIEHAVANPRDLDRRLVDAQEARRILDRLYGYELSPVLWRRVLPRLSAGRVQSVATRLIVERERERIAFTSASYWDIVGRFETPDGSFSATLGKLDGTSLATGKDFDATGAVKAGAALLDEHGATTLAAALDGADFAVRSVDEKPWTQSPRAPFMTSTMQQEAGRKLRFQAGRTMRIAQRLYENGYITYMRTDSVTLSETAVAAARAQATEMYGGESVPDSPRSYASKVKNAQEAHEAIRPAGDTFRTPEQVRDELEDEEFRLYDLIWKRTVASQMADARGRSIQVRLGATSSDGHDAEFGASGKTITFPGFLRAYVEGSDDPEAELEDQERVLPPLSEGDHPRAIALEPKGHDTQPPARYTEASLVKALEEKGIGRPSTYASIIDTIEDRGYVFKKGPALVPSVTAFVVTQLLEAHFGHLVDYEFTARMEDDLDQIANGDQESIPYLRRFYHGNGEPGLYAMVHTGLDQIDAREVNAVPIGVTEDGVPIEARPGRYGPYLRAGDRTASIPEDLPLDELTVAKALELLDAPSDDRVLGNDPETGKPIMVRNGRFGPYVQLGEADGDDKPKTASLLRTMSPDTLILEDALRLLTLPRVVGQHPDGGEITARHGRYGPYISWEKENRTLEREEQLFTITLHEAIEILKQPRRGRGQRGSAPALKELGVDPVSGGQIVVKDGRYGPYVTDGETNASLKRDDSVDSLTIERAAELLQARREAGPAKKTRKRAKAKASSTKASSKKASSKKASSKKASSKKKTSSPKRTAKPKSEG